jgi:hypothetical protein
MTRKGPKNKKGKTQKMEEGELKKGLERRKDLLNKIHSSRCLGKITLTQPT